MKWLSKPLAEVADFALGKMLDDKKNRGEPLPYLANINVRWGEFDLDDLREMRFEHHEMDRYGLRYGDIVMCEGGEPGRCAIWKDTIPGMMIQKALHRIRPHPDLDHRFLFYSFLHKGRTGALSPFFTGATIKHLPREQLARVEIAFPQLDIQGRIADILSAQDDLIENNRRRMALLQDAAQHIYREWFVRLRFPGHERSAISNGVPDGWKRLSINDFIRDEIVDLQTGPFGTQLKASDYIDDGTPVVNVRNLGYGELRDDKLEFVPEHVADRLDRHLLKPGDIVFGRKGAVDRHLLVSGNQDGWMQGSDCIRLRALSNVISTVYLSFGFRQEGHKEWMLRQSSNKATMASLNQDVIGRLPVVLPTTQLLREFDDFASDATRQLGILQRQNRTLCAARDLLLPRLMSGEIAV